MNIDANSASARPRTPRGRRNIAVIAALVVVPKCLWCVFAFVGAVIGSASAPELCGDGPTTAGHASAIATGIVCCTAGVVAWLRRGHRRLGVPRLLSSPTNQ